MNPFPALLLIFALALAALPQSADVLLRSALDKESVDGDLKGAIAAYQRILDSPSAPREIKAKALLQQADCHRKLGNEESQRLYTRLLKEYPEQTQIIAEAQSRMASPQRADEVRQRLILGGPDHSWSGPVSGAGRYLAYTMRTNEDYYYLDTVTGKQSLLLRVSLKNGQAPLISPDGARMAFARTLEDKAFRGFGIYVAPVGAETASAAPLVAFDRADVTDWHPTRPELIILHHQEGQPAEISVLDIPKATHRVLFRQPQGERSLWWPQYTPDGQHIVFLRWPSGEENKCYFEILPASGGAPTRLPVPFAQNRFYGITADNQIIYRSNHRGDEDLWSLRLKDGKADGQPRLLQHSVPGYRVVGLAPDGRMFHDVGNQRIEILSAEVDMTAARVLSGPTVLQTPFQGRANSPAYSPDGRFLAYSSGPREKGELRIRDLSSGVETAHALPLFRLDKIRWFPDGKSLLLYANDYAKRAGFFRYEIATKQFSNVFLFQTDAHKYYSDAASTGAVTPDGASIVFKYRADRNRSAVGVMSLTGGPVRDAVSFVGPIEMRMVALSPDGKTLALGMREKDRDFIAVVPFTGGEPKTIYRYPANEYQLAWGALAFSADGKYVLFQREHRKSDDQIWRVSVEGGDAKPLFTTGMIKDFAIHPDNRRIALWAETTHVDTHVIENLVKVSRQP